MAADPTQLETHRRILAYESSWWEDFQRQVRGGRPWVLSTLVAPREVFEAMGVLVLEDLTLVQTPKPREAYQQVLKDHGYLASLQGLGNRLALALALDEEDSRLWCGLPRPAMVCTTASDRSAHAMAVHYGIPYLEMETPALRRMTPNWWDNCRWDWEDLDEPDRIDLMQAQYEELIAYIEKTTGPFRATQGGDCPTRIASGAILPSPPAMLRPVHARIGRVTLAWWAASALWSSVTIKA